MRREDASKSKSPLPPFFKGGNSNCLLHRRWNLLLLPPLQKEGWGGFALEGRAHLSCLLAGTAAHRQRRCRAGAAAGAAIAAGYDSARPARGPARAPDTAGRDDDATTTRVCAAHRGVGRVAAGPASAASRCVACLGRVAASAAPAPSDHGRCLCRLAHRAATGAAPGVRCARCQRTPWLAARAGARPGLSATAAAAGTGAGSPARTPARDAARDVAWRAQRSCSIGAAHAAAGTRCIATRIAVDLAGGSCGLVAVATGSLSVQSVVPGWTQLDFASSANGPACPVRWMQRLPPAPCRRTSHPVPTSAPGCRRTSAPRRRSTA